MERTWIIEGKIREYLTVIRGGGEKNNRKIYNEVVERY
jgi:hypothetical protein